MMGDNLAFSRKLIKRFILMYRDCSCLWDKKNKNYRHRKKRHEAISQLTELVREYHPSATPVHVLRKIENLRVCARREYKRVCISRLTNSGTDLYVPQLWYYDLISFLFEGWPNVKQESPELDFFGDEDYSNLRGVPLAVHMPGEYSLAFSRKLTKRFILMYRDCSCLWDKKNKNYRHKEKRHEAISQLTGLVREYHPSATPVHVMKKIESLRVSARREYKRVCNSRLTNSGTGVYVPQLWYYDLISFVFEEWPNFKQESPELDTEESDEAEPTENVLKFEATDDELNRPTSIIEITNNIPRQYTFEDQTSKRQSGIEDEYGAIGINVAAKLRSMPQSTRIIAEKLINDVIFLAQVNGLTSSSVISTPDPIKQDI